MPAKHRVRLCVTHAPITVGTASPSDYFLPARSDMPVRALWAWMRERAPGGVELYDDGKSDAGGREDYWPRERILDRHEQHVKSCKTCSVRMPPCRSNVLIAE